MNQDQARENRPILIGYTSLLSARAGENIEVKVSSGFSSDYTADLVRIFSGDPNPNGPGVDVRPVSAAFEGTYRSVAKPSRPGSYGIIPFSDPKIATDATFSIRFQPRLLRESPQVLFSFIALSEGAVSISLQKDGLNLEAFAETSAAPFAFELGRWYELRLSITSRGLHLVGYSVETGSRSFEIKTGRLTGKAAFAKLVLAATPQPKDPLAFTSFFNGRLETPRLLRGAQLIERLVEGDVPEEEILAFWNFGVDIPTSTIRDEGPLRLDGTFHNLPARAVRGSRWSGAEMCWRHAVDEYAAVHFHEDDLYDCGWETDFSFDIPDDLPSGVYGIRLRCENAEDIIPFFVRPARHAAKARVAVLFSTFTYVAYANHPRSNLGAAYIERRNAWHAYPYHPEEYPEFGRSLYNLHADGSGVMFSSTLRPQLLMRPGYLAYVDERGSGLRHFPADLHLIAWCAAKDIAVDVVTDHDLEAEGSKALEEYALVLTVTHPEYHTARTLDAIQSFLAGGGSLGYLGGNGFYWRIATSEAFPGAIEIRRGETGARAWEAEPGEYFHAFDGRYGGLWLKNDRPPQRLVGIGMSAHGDFTGSFYRRTDASYDPRFAWLFDGIDGEILGDFGLSGGGAAGFEVDIIDSSLGTPTDVVVLAKSEEYLGEYHCVPEKACWPQPLAWQSSQIRADLCFIAKEHGNFVFSAGSILFCGSLPVNDFKNNISKLLENVVRRCLSGR
ncbi:N,N-dimethylformamidase beta subunit family domain-containing protein [Mesorhizobium sp.]|uniref:N,N-dimethylformamidase beta subunit family domain-containing protein n=1 Tax=Mesorhizobium sp. TaxID=1871066 RepID=UPI000FE4E79B|nr:N,N-dimethylformamidase beta subunit family domain-containing protein [Mesorhizobium sp.]RWK58061.1 MAG: N,N-dimethylformamidase large subunit [Mesorhizobium sp.]RWM40978.1 MAG: N,N-dimethylformamidase large subunit [Mesorhizobium sp.]RWO22289.1 MAG: N,N-dimethylformamidase large subunit [Mesorhizobium sp.]